MQQQISAVTLGISDLPRSRRFYTEGFGWSSIFANEEIIFYQMNGFVLGTFNRSSLEDDMSRKAASTPSAYSLAHNVGSEAEVVPLMDRLIEAGGTLIRKADAPVTEGSVATWQIPTVTLGKSRTILIGLSTSMGM
jgi:catechol 2,3-dioxygenase-like lactoylglutathione lyase family enzyme